LNLSSKFSDRVAYKITELASKVNLYKYPGGQMPSAEELRMNECLVMKSLDFKIAGGQVNIFDSILQTLKAFEHFSQGKDHFSEKRQCSSIKAKAI
jgi:hypothetical protein